MSAERRQIEAGRLARQGTGESRRQAIDGYREAVRQWHAIGDAQAEAQALNEMGEVHFALGETAAATEQWRAAEALAVSVHDRRGEARSIENLGLAASISGDQAAALAAYRRALAVYQDLGAQRRGAILLHNIGTAHRNQGELPEALASYEQALARERALEDGRAQSSTLLGMAMAYSMLGEQHRALEACERALPLARASGDRGLEASVLERLGERWLNLGDATEARGVLAAALDLSRQAGDGFREANTLTALGTALRMTGDHAQAYARLEEAFALRGTQNDRASQAALLVQLGMAARLMGATARAEGHLLDAIARFQARSDRDGEGYALIELGVLDQGRGELDRAAARETRAVDLLRTARDAQGEALGLFRLAQVRRAQGDLEEARQRAQEALARIESLRARISGPPWRLAYFVTAQDLHEFYIDLLMQLEAARPGQGFAARAFEASEAKRARGLMDVLVEMRADARSGLSPEDRRAEAALRGRLSARLRQQVQLLATAPADPQAGQLAAEIEGLLADYGRVEARLRDRGATRSLAEARPSGLREIQARLDADTTIVEFSLGEAGSYAWAVTRDDILATRLPPRREVAATARAYYARVSTSPAGRARPRMTAADPAAALGRQLLGPFRDRLRARRLLIVPDGVLHYVPFAALRLAPDEDGTTAAPPLVHDHEIVVLPSASAAVLLASAPAHAAAPNTVAMFADPVFERDDPRLQHGHGPETAAAPKGAAGLTRAAADLTRGAAADLALGKPGELPRLPFSRREADAIASLAPAGSVLRAVGFEASRATALGRDLGAYRILHFATHGLLDDGHPERSGLALSSYDAHGNAQDGFLRLEDIYEMRLPVELVVLSACRTALGADVRGEGLTGLVRAFMHAGAARVMATQWSVDDRATAELMREFYRALLVAHCKPAEALRRAQLRVQAHPAWRDPFYWAGFVLSGAWP